MAAAMSLSIAAFMAGVFSSADESPSDVLISNFASILAGAGAVVKIAGATVVVSNLAGSVDVATVAVVEVTVVAATVVVSSLPGSVDVVAVAVVELTVVAVAALTFPTVTFEVVEFAKNGDADVVVATTVSLLTAAFVVEMTDAGVVALFGGPSVVVCTATPVVVNAAG